MHEESIRFKLIRACPQLICPRVSCLGLASGCDITVLCYAGPSLEATRRFGRQVLDKFCPVRQREAIPMLLQLSSKV